MQWESTCYKDQLQDATRVKVQQGSKYNGDQDATRSNENHFGVFQVGPNWSLWSEYAPGSTFHVGKKNLLHLLKEKRCSKICDLFRWGIFTHFHSARLKTHYILPQLPPMGRKGVGESGEDVTSLIWPKKSHFVLFNFLFRSLWTEFSVEITFTL